MFGTGISKGYFKCAASMLQVYKRAATDVLKCCYMSVTGLHVICVCYMYLTVLLMASYKCFYSSATGILQMCYCTCVLPALQKAATDALQLCYRCVSGLLQVCYSPAIGILQVCRCVTCLLHVCLYPRPAKWQESALIPVGAVDEEKSSNHHEAPDEQVDNVQHIVEAN